MQGWGRTRASRALALPPIRRQSSITSSHNHCLARKSPPERANWVSISDSVDLQTQDGYFTFMLNCLLSEREILINKWRSRIGIERAKKEG
jgi:hypothetical protein